MTDRKPAEVFPPSEFIVDELEARCLDKGDLLNTLRDLISGKRSMTPQLAKELGDAFGTGPEFWMNLESAYQKAKAQDGMLG